MLLSSTLQLTGPLAQKRMCMKTSMIKTLSPTRDEYLLSGDAVHDDVLTEICNLLNEDGNLDFHDFTRILLDAAVVRDIDVNRMKRQLSKPRSVQFTDDSGAEVAATN